MKGVVISMLVVLAIVQIIMPGEAVDCGDVNSSLSSCISFLTGGDASPPDSCCAGLKNLKTLAPTTADRRAVCDCIQAAAANFPNIQDDAATSLPGKCGVDLHIPISKTTNCQAIN